MATTAQRYFAALMRGFHQYAAWLVSISWKRFLLLALLLLILAGFLSSIPPFTWKRTETTVEAADRAARTAANKARDAARDKKEKKSFNVTIDDKGIRIIQAPRASEAAGAAPSARLASEPRSSAETSKAPTPPTPPLPPQAPQADLEDQINITLPPDANSEEVRRAVADAKEAIVEAIRDARGESDTSDASDDPTEVRVRTITTSFGEALPEMAFLWILASAIVKVTYRGQLRAEARAAVASETAEAETLKRQVVEARMAAMQAQVEPHFLFNTLASIDHLIETDPPRASKMQKNLIALLRASMPTMRESSSDGLRDLGSELAVVRPYVEILKVRMDERLDAQIDIPDGLKSATFPPMMLQSLVENAVKHGLEPKPEGGSLRVKAEIIDGSLVVRVADTGLGFGQAATQGTGVGLANIRERLQLVYGKAARLTISANTPSGTIATITVPYRSATANQERA